MFDIHVLLTNSPGSLALMATTLGKNGVGLEGGGVFAVGSESHAHYLVEEGECAREVLAAAGFSVLEVVEPVIRKLKQERPGELGEIMAVIARNGINLLVQYSDHRNRLILLTDNNELTAKVTQQWEVSSA